MASIRKEIVIDASAERVWDALRDWGALHVRLVPGFATDARLDGEDRIVTFFNGSVLRERLVDLDDDGAVRHSVITSVTAARAEDSSTIDLLSAKAATSD